MRTTSIAILILSLFALAGCKYPDTVQLHDYAEQDFGGPIQWHPYVKKDYQEFQDWATGANSCDTETKEPGPDLAAQDS